MYNLRTKFVQESQNVVFDDSSSLERTADDGDVTYLLNIDSLKNVEEDKREEQLVESHILHPTVTPVIEHP